LLLNIASRDFQILVGGLDVTRLCSAEGGGYWIVKDDKLSANGIMGTNGQLVLVWDLTFEESLDPRKNPTRWAIGTEITVRVANSTGALVLHSRSGLRISALPKVPTRSDPFLRLTLSDRLSLVSFRSPPDEKSGVVLGTARARSAIINSLIVATQEPGLILVDAIVDYSIKYPLPRFTDGSYVAQAGKVAYSALRILWVNNTGAVRAIPVSLSPGLLAAKTVYELLIYDPLEGTELPTEIVRCAGTTRDVEAVPDRIDYPWQETYGPASVISPTLVGYTLLGRVGGYETWDGTRRIIRTITYKVLGALFPDEYPGSTTLWNTDNKIETWIYEGSDRGRLISKSEVINTVFGDALRDWIANNSNAVNNIGGGTIRYDLLSPLDAQKTTTQYTYDLDVIVKILVTTRELIGALVPNEPGIVGADNLTDSSVVETRYRPGIKPNEWQKSIVTQQSLVKAYPETAGGKPYFEQIQLIPIGTGSPDTSSGGDSTPPQPEYKPDTHTTKDRAIEGQWRIAPYPGGTYQIKIDVQLVDYAVSSSQLQQLARVRSGLRVGAHQGYTIRCPMDDYWLHNYQPYQRFEVTEEDGTIQAYLVDGVVWALSDRERSVSFDAIWLGTKRALNNGVGVVDVIIPPYVVSDRVVLIDSECLDGGDPLPYSLTLTIPAATLIDSESLDDANSIHLIDDEILTIGLPRITVTLIDDEILDDANSIHLIDDEILDSFDGRKILQQEFEEKYTSGKNFVYVPLGAWQWVEDVPIVFGTDYDPILGIFFSYALFTQCDGSILELRATYGGILQGVGSILEIGIC